MTNLTTFNYLSNTVRVVEIDGQPWFVAVDLYSVLFGRTTGVSVREFIQPDETQVIRKVSAPDALTSLLRERDIRSLSLPTAPSTSSSCAPTNRRPVSSKTGSPAKSSPRSARMACTWPVRRR